MEEDFFPSIFSGEHAFEYQWCLDQDQEFVNSTVVVGCVEKNADCTTPLNLFNPTPIYTPTDNYAFNASKVTVEVYPNIEAEVKFKVRLLDNPLDLYFLMDFTSSMESTVDQLYIVAQELGEHIKGLSSDYQVGFGTFVDKCVPPFAKFYEYYDGERRPYSFRYP